MTDRVKDHETRLKNLRLANRFREIKFFFMEFVCESMQKFFSRCYLLLSYFKLFGVT